MADPPPSPRPASVRLLATGWRLASAETAFAFAGGAAALGGLLAWALPGSSPHAPSAGAVLATTGAAVATLVLLGAALLLACRFARVDGAAGLLRVPWAAPVPLDQVVLVGAVGHGGLAPTGSGRRYRYAMYHVAALLRAGATGAEAELGAVRAAALHAAAVPAPGTPRAAPGRSSFARASRRCSRRGSARSPPRPRSSWWTRRPGGARSAQRCAWRRRSAFPRWNSRRSRTFPRRDGS